MLFLWMISSDPTYPSSSLNVLLDLPCTSTMCAGVVPVQLGCAIAAGVVPFQLRLCHLQLGLCHCSWGCAIASTIKGKRRQGRSLLVHRHCTSGQESLSL